jgi:hypothetical protein
LPLREALATYFAITTVQKTALKWRCMKAFGKTSSRHVIEDGLLIALLAGVAVHLSDVVMNIVSDRIILAAPRTQDGALTMTENRFSATSTGPVELQTAAEYRWGFTCIKWVPALRWPARFAEWRKIPPLEESCWRFSRTRGDSWPTRIALDTPTLWTYPKTKKVEVNMTFAI